MLFCLGVKIPYSTGIGGGFVAAYYSKGKVKVLDALGVSPAAITEDTFKNVTMENLIGPMSAIVPGAVMGYENLLRMTNSKVAWADLIKPAIDLATNGFPVDPKLAVYLRAIHPKKAADLLAVVSTDGRLLQTGETLKQPKLAGLLQKIATHGHRYLYGEEMGAEIEESMKASGGFLAKVDMLRYQPVFFTPTTIRSDYGRTLHVYPEGTITIRVANGTKFLKLPGPGAIAKADREKRQPVLMGPYKKYNLTMELLIDTHGIVLSVFKDCCGLCVASGLHLPWGSQFMTKSGLLLNNYMATFSGHRPEPHKRPYAHATVMAVTSGYELKAMVGSNGAIGTLVWQLVLLCCMESYDFDSCTSGGRNAYGAYPIQQPRRLRGPPEESEGREGEVEEEEEQDEDADEHLEADEDEETDGDEGKEEQMEAVNESGVAGSKKRIGLKARGMPSDDDGAPDLFTRQL